MKATPPYLDTCSNWLRSGALTGVKDKREAEQLFADWSITRSFVYSLDHSSALNQRNISDTYIGKDIFKFPWNTTPSLSLFSDEIRRLVEAELSDPSHSEDEKASNLLDILGPEHFELIQELCAKKNRTIRLESIETNRTKVIFPKIPGIYSQTYGNEKPVMTRHSVALPLGTIHECIPGREYFCFPARQSSDAVIWGNMQELDVARSFPHLLLAAGGKNLFPYESLNKMQSIVYPTAFNSNENMLVAAPTGAGKTDVALMGILRVIWAHMKVDNHSLIMDKHGFKIVYIVPMKALAAEIAAKYQHRLLSLGVVVREYTGDMKLTNRELEDTNILISTPEKWDVLTRNPSFSDSILGAAVKLIILDEVHLLNDARGAVLETLVARTLRYVEGAQRMVRIIGLSATLPNFMDVAEWLRVSVGKGLFFFDTSFRPVPLKVTLIGVNPSIIPSAKQAIEDAANLKRKSISHPNINYLLDHELIEGLRPILLGQHQALVFVHSRAQTIKVARLLSGSFGSSGLLWKIDPCPSIEYAPLRNLLAAKAGAVGVHHAGMSRSDRQTIEMLFRSRRLSLLVCTSTLAWGVNLPARAVFIRGTDVFNEGSWGDLSSLDVLQIFGRAGRPGLDDAGEATLLCSSKSLPRYLLALSPANAVPIESTFATNLDTHLNAEINLGTVRSIEEGLSWLSYTFFWVRARQKGATDLNALENVLKSSINRLIAAELCIKDNTMKLAPTELGEITSRLYLSVETVCMYQKRLDELSQSMPYFSPQAVLSEIIRIFVEAKEFTESIKMRSHDDSEDEELLRMLLGPKLWLQRPDVDPTSVSVNFTGSWNSSGNATASSYLDKSFVPLFDPTIVDWTASSTKVSVLFQAYISGWGDVTSGFRKKRGTLHFDSPDLHYITLNAGRFLRAIFEIALRFIKDAQLAFVALELCRCFENRTWSTCLLSSSQWWDSLQLLNQAGCLNPSSDLILKIDSSFDKELLCAGWSRKSPLQNLMKSCPIEGIPWISLENIRAYPIQVIQDKILLDIQWNLSGLSSVKLDETLWAIISLPHNHRIIWSGSFSVSKDQPLLRCRVNTCIELSWFPDLDGPISLYLSILNNARIGLDVLNVPFPIGTFREAEDNTQHNTSSYMMHPIEKLRNPIPQQYFLLGRGKASSLFPPLYRPFLEVSRVISSPLLKSLLYAKNIYSFSAVQSLMARVILHPFDNCTTDHWAHERTFISVLAPSNSGKTLALELAIWSALNTNNKTKVIVLTHDSYQAGQLLKKWSYSDSLFKYLDVAPSVSTDSSFVVAAPNDILAKWDFSQMRSLDTTPLLVIIKNIEMIGDCPAFELAISILRYWTHSHHLCRWMVFGRPFASSPDMISWLSLDSPLALFCGPEVSLAPAPAIIKLTTNGTVGSIVAEISRHVSADSVLVVWVYSKKLCRLLASKLSIILARHQIGSIDDESVFPFKDDLLQRTVSQSGVAFWTPSEKNTLLAASSFVRVLLVPVSPATTSSIFSFTKRLVSGRLTDNVIIVPPLHKSLIVDASIYYTPCQLLQMFSIAKGFPTQRKPRCILLGPSELCSMICLIFQAENGYKVPIESSLVEFSAGQKPVPYISSTLMAMALSCKTFETLSDFIVSVKEIECLFQWTFLYRRIRSNPAYYGWMDLRSLVIETLVQLDKLGSVSFDRVKDEVRILPHCRLSALHSFSPRSISNLDNELQKLWKSQD